MPLPLENERREIPSEVCCPTFFDVAEHLLMVVFDDVSECAPSVDGRTGPPLVGFVTVGERPEDPYCDTIQVSMVSSMPTTRDRVGNTIPFGPMRATFSISLRESGWPMAWAENEEIWVPAPELVHGIARHSYSHGERMYRSILQAHRTGTLTPAGCVATDIGPLIPLAPLGGCVGWMTNVTVQVVDG